MEFKPMADILRASRASPVHLVVIVLTALVFAVGVYTSDRFATPLNLANVQDQMVALAIVALAQTIVILSGGIDLSYAGALSIMSVVFALLAGDDRSCKLHFGGSYCSRSWRNHWVSEWRDNGLCQHTPSDCNSRNLDNTVRRRATSYQSAHGIYPDIF